VREENLQKKCRWLGNSFRETTASVTRHAIIWNQQGKRKRGRPKITWQRIVETEMREMNLSWGWMERLSQVRDAWRAFVGGQCHRSWESVLAVLNNREGSHTTLLLTRKINISRWRV
jgi:hypothetical protein